MFARIAFAIIAFAAPAALSQPQITGAPTASPEPIMVAILWHQHQPHYLQNPDTGEYAQPWVRLHAVKDYCDMVTILDHHPNVRVTVNLTPVLINQMRDLGARWENGHPTDAYVRHTLLDPAEMTGEEKAFVLRNFFSLNWQRMLERHPRYVELRDKRPGTGDAEIAQAIAAYTDQDFRDLQMLFNLAWMDPDFFEGATLPDGTEIDVGPWVEQGRDFTEEDKRTLIAMHFQIMAQVIPIHRAAQDRGQIEVSTTPFYHPILPLIVDTDSAREAVPGIALPRQRFQQPGDARQHVTRAASQYAELFGEAPRGLWPGEGSVSHDCLPLFADAGITWFATDVQVLARSLGVNDPPAAQRFSMWQCRAGDATVAGIFRDTGLSDRIGFTYSSWDGAEAAQDFVRILHDIREAVAREAQRPLSQHVIPVILDGENCWESYENDGKEFLETLYTLLGGDPLLRTVTVSECLMQSGELPVIDRLAAGSWISANFETWIGEDEENRAWDLLAGARAAFASAEFTDGEDHEIALDLLLRAEGSDWFWWYGSDQSVDGEQAFDEQFRGTLRHAYAVMGLDPPAELDQPIMQGAGAASGGGVMAPGMAP